MPRSKKPKVADEEMPMMEPAPKEEMMVTEAHVFNRNGSPMRVYMLADHGENFAALAQEFASQYPGARVEVR